MRTGYSMTVRWTRECGMPYLIVVSSPKDKLLARNWRALNAFHVTRMRVLAQADRLAAAIALAED